MKKPVVAASASHMHLLHRASQHSDELFAKAAEGSGITARQYIVMSIVAECGDPSQTIISEKSGIDRSTLADIVARLVSRGLLARRRTKSDARKYAVRLTDKGRLCLEQASMAAQSVEGAIARAMSPEQRSVLVVALEQFIATAAALEGSKAARKA